MSGINSSPVSCVECQRRKQKCNRQFPCNHCSKRGVAHLCRFASKAPTPKTNRSDPSENDGPSKTSKSKKRNFDRSDDDSAPEEALYPDACDPSFNASDALNALGYMPHTHHLVLGRGTGPKADKDLVGDNKDKGQSEELKAALALMPPKPYTDCLVDNWLSGANYHYYALYPPEFRTQYDGWWAAQASSATPELTSLVLRVCACSALYIIDDGVRRRLESELKADSTTFAIRMHEAAEKLSASIPHGKGGLVHVQQLFLTAFWYKSAEKWTQAWHALSAAIRAAYEIGLHKDSLSEGMSEFDREMRRRLWSVLYLWDFALGAMLSRPSLVSRADCTFELPTLALEIDPGQPYQPSPFRHMKLHCQMCIDLAAVMSNQSQNDGGINMAQNSRLVLEKWFKDLPAEYAVRAPDTRWDSEHDWVVFQRRYLHLVGYMSLFAILKRYVTLDSAERISDLESDLREAGVQAALDLMDISYIFFENLVSAGAKFHYAVFCIFDTTTVMCSAFVHDKAHNLPQRDVVLPAIKKGLAMLETLRSVSKTISDLCRMLKDLLVSLPLSTREKGLIGAPKRVKPSSPELGVKEFKAPMRPTNRSVSAESNPTEVSRSTLSDNDDALIATPAGTDEGAVGSSITSDSDNTFATPDVLGSSVGFSHQTGSSPSTHDALASASPISIPPTAEQLQPVAMVSPQHLGPPNDHSQSSSLLDGYSPPSDLMLPNGQPPLHDFHYGNLQPPPLDAERLGQVAWETSTDPASNMSVNFISEANVITLSPNMPSVLQYWDWESLQLGNPNYWGGSNPPPM